MERSSRLVFSSVSAGASGVTDGLVPNIRGQLEDIRALGFPEDDEDTVDSALSAADDVLDEVEADPSILLSADPFADVNTALNDYGLTECGS